MTYADTDFFLALLKPTDWLKKNARRILVEEKGEFKLLRPPTLN